MGNIIDIPPAPQSLHFDEVSLAGSSVIVQLMDGKRINGILEELNGPLEKVVITQKDDDKRLFKNFEDIRYLLFSPRHPVYPVPNSEDHLPLNKKTGKNTRKFQIQFIDNKIYKGFITAHVADIYGLHLFRTSDIDEIHRIFIPSKSIRSYSIGPLLGEIFQNKNLTGKDEINKAIKRQDKLRKVKTTSNIDEKQITHASSSSESANVDNNKTGDRIGEILEEQGVISDEDLHKSIAEKFATPYLHLSHMDIDPKLIDYIPAEIARKHLLIPVRMEKNHLTIAMEDPTDIDGINMVHFITGIHPDIVVSSKNDIETALNYLYDPLQEEAAVETTKQENDEEINDIQKLGEQKPIVRLANIIISEAIRRNASDIHIRPGENIIELLFRIDGSMIKIRDFPKSLLPALVSRIKILGNLDISEKRIPQDGRTRIVTNENIVDLRISIIPTINGESVVIRLLNTKLGIKRMEDLDFSTDDSNTLRNTLHKMHGLVLVTGPTGSGKSTTLYAALHEVMGRQLNIITVEDPVEYHIEGIEQVQVNTATGLSFARALRNILRHDPDIIMIGEIRDEETARIAIQSSLTGHMVLSTLHTNSAVGAITRLKDMNIESYLIAPTILCVIAQRLLKCICPNCSEKQNVTDEMQKVLNIDKDETFYIGKGCDYCNQTGYSGRTAVYELLLVNPEIREAIKKLDSESAIQEAAINSGMVTLTQNALARAREGIIPVSEVYRIAVEN